MASGHLAGRVAWVTGAGKGIGEGVALALAAQGARVALSARSVDDLEAVAAKIRAAGGVAMVAPADVSSRESVEAAYKDIVEAIGAPSVVVCNAGISQGMPFLKTSLELWEKILTVNLTGVFHTMQLSLPEMLTNQWGRIIVIASVAAKVSDKYMSAYAASKHGVLGLTRAVAKEVAHKGVTVNAICPGYVDTPMTEQTLNNIMAKTGQSRDQAMGYLNSLSPQNRIMTVEEIAGMASFLCQDEARGIHGQGLNIDGGGCPY